MRCDGAAEPARGASPPMGGAVPTRPGESADGAEEHDAMVLSRDAEDSIRLVQSAEGRNAKLRELGLDGDLALFPPKHAKQTATTTRKRKAEAAAPAEPTRRSSRSRSQPAANLYVVEEDEKTGRVVLGGSDAQAAKIGAKRVAATHPDELPIGFEDLRPGLERKVWQILREARNAKAKAMERSMFIVCNDRTLCEIVRTVPTEVEQLHDLYGMGEKKVKAHGALLLEALRPHADALKADHEAARAVLDDERPSQGAHLVVD